MTGAVDTAEERLAEYHQLFATVYQARERRGRDSVRLRFQAAAGTEDWVRDLAAREHACCGFFTFSVQRVGNEVIWDASVPDDDVARAILDAFYDLPETFPADAAALFAQFRDAGLEVVISTDGVYRPASAADLGIRTRPVGE